jgi:aminoglycoside/choline kinase family phosphotransferase
MKIGDVIRGYRLTQRLDQGGSERKFFRCTAGDNTFVMIHDQDIDQYIEIYHHLFGKGISVPRIYWYNPDEQLMIQEDLGDLSLFVLSKKDKNTSMIYQQAIDELIKLQIDGRHSTPVKHKYDREHIQWEQDYFRDYFLVQYCRISKAVLPDIVPDFQKLADQVLKLIEPISDYLMHRDFQSQNIYMKDGQVRIIDFQSARIGPLTYDLAALLRDPYVKISAEQERKLFRYYIEVIHKRGLDMSESEFWPAYELTCLQRSMQALGAFANLSLNKDKPQFARYIRRGLELLKYGLQRKNLTALETIISNIKI